MMIHNKPIRVLLGECREWQPIDLHMVFSEIPGIQVVAKVETVKEIFWKLQEIRPDIILLDIWLPDGSGLTACQQIVSEYPDTRVLFFSSVGADDLEWDALLAGSYGYFQKDIKPKALLQVLDSVMNGYSVFNQCVLQRIVACPKDFQHNPYAPAWSENCLVG